MRYLFATRSWTCRLARISKLLIVAGLAAFLVAVPAGRSSGAAAPSTPTGVTALALDAHVELSWQPVSGAAGYTVYRGTTIASITTPLTTVGGVSGVTYTDSTAANGTTYYYGVRASSGGLESATSSPAQATPLVRSCSSGNAIVLENCFAGTAAWKTTGATDAAHGGIEGFATQSSVDAGGSVDLKVNTASGVAYHVEIYRTGWYGGSQGRLVSKLPGLHGVAQPACQADDTTGLVDCSNWSATSTITTNADWPSGVYLLRLVREDNGTDNHVLLVVRHDESSAAMVYQVPVATYQAYNGYLGRSLYDFNSFGSNTVAGTPRAVKVSYDRPYQEPVSGLRNWYTFADIQNVSWSERQGYDITYLTSVDLQNGAAPLLGHSAFVSGAHDEYWSSQMRSAVTTARDSGVSLLFLGGNAVYWHIRFESSPFSGAPNRIETCYKTTQSGPADPSGIPTGTWRDPAGSNAPENALLGEMYIGDNDTTNFPLVVSAAQGQNRVWRYSTLASMAAGTTASIGQNLVGWEWDARFANGAEPAGVVTVASSPVTGEVLTDAGKVYNPNGSANATATEYRASSGAWVFATGTNNWSRGLGLDMNGVGEPNSLIQQGTMNVLGDMGVHPTTPQAGLTVDPVGAPSVTQTVPAAGATGVAAQAHVTATFNKQLDPSSITSSTFTLSGPSGAVAATVAYDSASLTATLTPSQALASGATYTATLASGIQTWAGATLGSPVTWSFTAASVANCPCSLFASSLAPSASHLSVVDGRGGAGPFSLELGVKVQVSAATPLTAIRFFKDSQETGSHVGRLWSASGTLLGSVTFAGESASGWQQQALASPVTLQPGLTYVVSVNANAFFGVTPAGLQSQVSSGVLSSVVGANGVFGSAAGVFPTGSFNSSNYFVDVVAGGTSGSTAPTVTSTSPAAGASGVNTATAVTATFSSALDASTVTGSTFSLSGPSGAVAATVAYDSASLTATLTPSQALQAGATYTASLSTGIHGSTGTPLASPVTWSFTTGVPVNCPCSLFASSLAPSASHLSVVDGRGGAGPFSLELGVKVQVSAATPLTAIRFFKDSQETGSHVGRLWSASGTLLGSVTFAGESASGWQQQALASPVTLQPGLTYVVSVNANAFFGDTPAGLQSQVSSGVLSSVVGANGVFGSAAGVFPTGSFNSSNYFVDVVVGGSTSAPPTVSQTSPTAGATAIGSAAGVTATFSTLLDASTVTGSTFSLSGPAGAVAATVSYDASSLSATLVPSQPLQSGATFTATLTSGIRSAAGVALAAPVSWSFTTANCPCSVLSSVATPSSLHLSVVDGRSGAGPFSYEFGVKVQVSSASQLTAIRFFKDSQETGSHVGRVWSASGTLLGSVTFAGESASGWQQQALASALTLQPGLTYVVSVNANAFFVVTGAGLASSLTSGPLSTVVGGNGVFGSAAGVFPTGSYNSSNYFIDPVVDGTPVVPLNVAGTSPSSGATNVGSMASPSASFSTAVDPATLTASTFSLSGPAGAVAATVSYDASSLSATLVPSQPLQSGATFTATLTSGIRSAAGVALAAPVSWSFTTANCPCSVLSSVATPSSLHLSVVDGRSGAGPFSYEFGVKVQVSSASQLTAIRFFKDSQETGSHVGRVWSASGTLLGSVTFAGESASGWQQQALASPVTLQPGLTYVVSVNANAFFVVTGAGLASSLTSGPLSTVVGGNGVFGSAAGVFPTGSYNSSNYFIDAVVG